MHVQQHIKINVRPEKAVTLVLPCCYLHNYLWRKEVESYYQSGFDIENISTGEITDADWRSDRTLLALQHIQGRNTTGSAKGTGQKFSRYFNTVGAVSWQANSNEMM